MPTGRALRCAARRRGGVLLPLTWHADDSLRVHVDAGSSMRRGRPDGGRAGLGLEWALPGSDRSVLVERFREERANV